MQLFLIEAVLVVFAIASVVWAMGQTQDWQGPAVSFMATLVLLALAVIAVADPEFAFLPEHPLPKWLSIRSSLVLISFFLGIVVAHFAWH